MKQLVTICILAIGMIANAQNTQTISKPLKLTSVPTGSSTDKVLVRDTAGMVKQVDKHTLVGEPIPPVVPTLQQVLTAGSTAIIPGNSNYYEFNDRGFEVGNKGGQTFISNNSIRLSIAGGASFEIFGNSKKNGALMLTGVIGYATTFNEQKETNMPGHLTITTINGVRYLCLGTGTEIVRIKIEENVNVSN